jgi:translation elongation factor EF-1beta
MSIWYQVDMIPCSVYITTYIKLIIAFLGFNIKKLRVRIFMDTEKDFNEKVEKVMKKFQGVLIIQEDPSYS